MLFKRTWNKSPCKRKIPVKIEGHFLQIHLLFFSHQYLGISKGSIPQVSQPETRIFPSSINATNQHTCSSLYDQLNNIYPAVPITNVLSVSSSSVPCNFIPPLFKYIPQHHIVNNLSWICSFFPFPLILFPFIHLKVQPKDMQIVTMWWHNVSVILQLSNEENNYNIMST